MSRFRFVDDHRDAYGVKRLCRIVGCSRSGFYDWCRRPPSRHARRDEQLSELIGQIHDRSRRTYGAPRVHAELRRLGCRCARKRVARLMAAAGRVGVHARRRWRAGRPDVAPAPDLVRRDFSPRRPDQIWAADISQLRTDEGFLHLASVLDLHSRRLVGWAMGPSPNADLVIDALLMAFARRRPDRRVVHHSDRGAAGGFNRSSQHLERGGGDGTAGGMDEGADGQIADEVAGGSGASPGGRARVLA